MELVGHRGARGLVAENTLASFAQALASGIHTLELDVRLSRDDVVVVHHDPCLNPEITQDAQGRWLDAPSAPIRELRFDELRQYRLAGPRAGSEYAKMFPQQQTHTAERVPNLDEVIDLVQTSANAQLRLIIEMKLDPRITPQNPTAPALCDAVIDVLQRRSMLGRSCLQSFQWQAVSYALHKNPDIHCAILTAARSDWDTINPKDGVDSPWTGDFQLRNYNNDLPKMVQATGCAVWAPDLNQLDAAGLAAAHALGLRVVVWTVNEITDIHRFMDLGVDGIITDYPDRVREIMAQRGDALPPPSAVADFAVMT